MPKINHYEAEVTLRFVIDGPLSPAGAAQLAEDRAGRALVQLGEHVKSAEIAAVAVRDTSVRPIHGSS
jgi:hypothetical protein